MIFNLHHLLLFLFFQIFFHQDLYQITVNISHGTYYHMTYEHITAWPLKSKHRLQPSPFYLLLLSSFFSFSFKYIIIVYTRSQTENISRDELVEELLKLSDVSSKLSELTEKFNDFMSKHDKVYSELQISRNCNNHLLQRIIQLERNAVTNSQYHRRETIEINPVPESLEDEILEENVCKALSLTGVNVTPEQLHSCHRLKKRNRVIVKFKCRKQR